MKKLFVLTGLILLAMNSISQTGVNVGDKAPLFTVKSDDGTSWSLSEHLGKSNIVLYFFPAAMSSGCTKEACSYRDHQEDLGKVNALVLGISGDDVAGLQVFKKAYNLNFKLLSDFNGAVANMYGVPVGAGGSLTRVVDNQDVVLNRGISAQRWTFIIGADGLIKYINRQVDAENDYKAVLNVLGNK